jgi:hypothetical protein
VYIDVVTRRLALTIAVVPLIVLIGLRSAWALYACSMDGKVRETCCCPKSKKQPAHDQAPRIVRADCCDVTLGKATEQPDAREADRTSTGNDLSIATAPAVIALPFVQPTPRYERTTFARPPPPAVPTFLANRTILR